MAIPNIIWDDSISYFWSLIEQAAKTIAGGWPIKRIFFTTDFVKGSLKSM